jgi:hypothetical protein
MTVITTPQVLVNESAKKHFSRALDTVFTNTLKHRPLVSRFQRSPLRSLTATLRDQFRFSNKKQKRWCTKKNIESYY